MPLVAFMLVLIAFGDPYDKQSLVGIETAKMLIFHESEKPLKTVMKLRFRGRGDDLGR